ncbi:MAG: pitrilysin family protein [Burkholderiaceae bacterium]
MRPIEAWLRLALLLAAGLCVETAQAGPALPTKVTAVEGIDEYRLANGLQVLLIADDSKPTTTVNLTYRVGSRHENYGQTGMAHLLEHLLFKGSAKHPRALAEFAKRGLAANGTTSYDRTNYTASFSSNDKNLHWYLGWQADAMVNSFIARKDLDTEMTVVRNEMEMGENSADRILFEKTLATMYQWHNYGKNTIGARTDVENVDIPSLRAFYKRYYQPDNATLIVAGRFPVQKTLTWIAQAFGPIARPQERRAVTHTLDAIQDGERSVTLRRVGGVPLLMAAYHVPPAAHADFAAVELLTLILGDTPSGRLHKRLTEKRLAADTFAFAQGLADPGFAIFGAQMAPGQDAEPARAELLATLESLANDPLSSEELERARAKWQKGWEQAFTNPEAVGVALSESVAQGDWRLFFLIRDRVRDATLADVQRVAEQRLLASNRTLGIYLPTDKPQRAPSPEKADVAAALRSFKPQRAAARVESFDATPANIDARTQLSEVDGIKAALLVKGTRGGAVHAVLTLHFGDEAALSGQVEIEESVAALLDKGTGSLSRQQIQDRLDQLKTELSVHSQPGRVDVRLRSRREHLPAAIALLADVLRDPVFPAQALDELKRQTLASIEQQRREPESVAANAIARLTHAYPRGDVRYARSFDEWVADVNAVDIEQVRAFHRRFYGAAKAEFSAVGEFDEAQLRQALSTGLGGWKTGTPFRRIEFPAVSVKSQRLLLNTPDKQNATLLARSTVPLNDEADEYPALTMANYLLGGGGNSRLWKRIREREGLSYDVRSHVQWNNFEPNSVWIASAIYAPQNLEKVEAAFREEIDRALRDGFTAQELAEGQRGLLSFRRLSRAQDGSLAASLANNLYLGRSFALAGRVDAALTALTLAQVNAALRKYIRPEAFVIALAGDFK